MLNLLKTQNAIIAGNSEQAHSGDKTGKDYTVKSLIKAGDYVLCFSEWTGSKDDKHLQRWIGYLVTAHDPSYTILDLRYQSRYNSFHVTKLRLYTGDLLLHNGNRISHLWLKLTISKASKSSVTTSPTPTKYSFPSMELPPYRLADDIRRPAAQILVIKYLSQLTAIPRKIKAWMHTLLGLDKFRSLLRPRQPPQHEIRLQVL
jgi:hypothetical protein